MKHTSVVRYAALGTLVSCLALSGTGCSRWTEIKAGEPVVSKSGVSTAPQSTERVPALLSNIVLSQNGVAMAPANDLERRVLDTLAESQLFSRLIYPGYSATDPAEQHVRAKLTVALSPNPHAGEAAWKGILIGASMFTLAPALPLEYEYGAKMTLELVREDGVRHQYNVGAEGVAHYHLFGATHLAADELKAQIIETCLSQLQRELVKDREFVQAGYLAKGKTDPKGDAEVTALPTTAPVHRPARTISVLRSSAQ